MPSTFSKNLGLELMQTGENAGTWGDITNKNLQAMDDAVDGSEDVIVGPGGITITTDDVPAMSTGRAKVLTFSGTPGDNAVITIAPSDAEKHYFVRNESNKPLTFQQGSGAVYVLAAGYSAVIHCDGTGVGASVFGTLSSLQVDKLLVRGPQTITGDVTMSGVVNLTGAVTAASMTVSGATLLQGTLTVAGAVTLSGTLGVTGVVTLVDALNVAGAVSGASFSTAGAISGGTLTVSGAASIGSITSLSVTGGGSITGALTVTGAISGGTLNTTGAISGGTLTVSGAASLAATTASGLLHASANLRIDVGSDAQWDLYTRGPSNSLARIPAGTLGQFLRAGTGGQPGWQNLNLAIGNPLAGAQQGQVLFAWSGALAVGRLTFDWTNATLTLYQDDNAFYSRIVLDGVAAASGSAQSHYLRFNSATKGRWDLCMRTFASYGTDTFAIRRRNDAGAEAGVDFEMKRENGHIMMGASVGDAGAAVNITTHAANETVLIVKRATGQSVDMMQFVDSDGALLSRFDKDGKYITSGSAAWVYLGRTSTYSLGSDINTGALFFYRPAAQMTTKGGFLTFQYGFGVTFGSFYALLPTTDPQAAPVHGLTWSYIANGQPPRATLEEVPLEDIIRESATGVLDNLLRHPDLVLRLKEALAAL